MHTGQPFGLTIALDVQCWKLHARGIGLQRSYAFLDRESANSGFNKMNFRTAIYDMRLIEFDVVTEEMRIVLPDSATRRSVVTAARDRQ